MYYFAAIASLIDCILYRVFNECDVKSDDSTRQDKLFVKETCVSIHVFRQKYTRCIPSSWIRIYVNDFKNNETISTKFSTDLPCFVQNVASREGPEMCNNSVSDTIRTAWRIPNFGDLVQCCSYAYIGYL